MYKNLLSLSLMACWPAFASLAPLVGNDARAAETQTGRLINYLEPLGLTSHPHATDDPTLSGSAAGWPVEASGIVPFDPPLWIQANDPFQSHPPALSGGTTPPGKLAFCLILLIGAAIRLFTSSTFRDFLAELSMLMDHDYGD